MDRMIGGAIVAGAAALLLGACSSTSVTPSDTTGYTASSRPTDQSVTTMSTDTPAGATVTTVSGVVQQIEQLTRQDAGVGVGNVTGAAVGGTTTASPYDKVYRITVRMDDGTNKVMTQESSPTFQTGDRVQIVNGMLQRY